MSAPMRSTMSESRSPSMIDFTGHLSRASKGRVSVAEIHSDPQVVRHSREQVARSRFQMHFLHLQLEGESINRQDQREARLRPGDITICDNSRPYEIVFEQPNRMLVFGFPYDLLRRYIQYPQSIAAKRLSGSNGIGGLLSDFLSDVWRHCQDDREFEISAGVTDAILGLLASSYRQLLGSTIDHSSLGAAHRVRIIHYIEEHLGDSSLTPTRIASAFRITTRYLHHLFSEEDETVARYILRQAARGMCPGADLTVAAQAHDHVDCIRLWLQQCDPFRAGIPFAIRLHAEGIQATQPRQQSSTDLSRPKCRPSCRSGPKSTWSIAKWMDVFPMT